MAMPVQAQSAPPPSAGDIFRQNMRQRLGFGASAPSSSFLPPLGMGSMYPAPNGGGLLPPGMSTPQSHGTSGMAGLLGFGGMPQYGGPQMHPGNGGVVYGGGMPSEGPMDQNPRPRPMPVPQGPIDQNPRPNPMPIPNTGPYRPHVGMMHMLGYPGMMSF